MLDMYAGRVQVDVIKASQAFIDTDSAPPSLIGLCVASFSRRIQRIRRVADLTSFADFSVRKTF